MNTLNPISHPQPTPFTGLLKRLLGPALLAFALVFTVLPVLGQPPPEAEITETESTAAAENTEAADQTGRGPVILPAAPMPEFLNDNLVPIVAIVSVFGVPPIAILLLALLVFRHREKQQQLINERLQRFLEAGQPIPEQLLKSGTAEAGPAQLLNQGLVLLGLGIGLGIFLGLLTGWEIASLALIPIGIGIARLISWKMATRQPA